MEESYRQIDANKSNFDIFESALYIKSGSTSLIDLRAKYEWMIKPEKNMKEI